MANLARTELLGGVAPAADDVVWAEHVGVAALGEQPLDLREVSVGDGLPEHGLLRAGAADERHLLISGSGSGSGSCSSVVRLRLPASGVSLKSSGSGSRPRKER